MQASSERGQVESSAARLRQAPGAQLLRLAGGPSAPVAAEGAEPARLPAAGRGQRVRRPAAPVQQRAVPAAATATSCSCGTAARSPRSIRWCCACAICSATIRSPRPPQRRARRPSGHYCSSRVQATGPASSAPGSSWSASTTPFASHLEELLGVAAERGRDERRAGRAAARPGSARRSSKPASRPSICPDLIRRQSVCAVLPQSAPQPLFSEIYVAIRELAKALAPGVDLPADTWLFQRLAASLDRRLLTCLAQRELAVPQGAISLNLRLATLLSPDFLKFDHEFRAGGVAGDHRAAADRHLRRARRLSASSASSCAIAAIWSASTACTICICR